MVSRNCDLKWSYVDLTHDCANTDFYTLAAVVVFFFFLNIVGKGAKAYNMANSSIFHTVEETELFFH